MEMQDIITLIKTVSESNLTSFQYEEGNLKLSFETARGIIMPEVPKNLESVCSIPPVLQNVPVEEEKDSDIFITSPMVGTFYTAASEDGEAFVAIGDYIKTGQVVGIVEAMKLMNEIQSPYDGVVEAILVNNKDMIGFNQNIIKLCSR